MASQTYKIMTIKLANGKYRAIKIHKLVAAAFLPDYDPYLFINHIDHNTWNNDISNLECIYPEDNSYHAYNIATSVDTSMIYEVRDENNDIYGHYHSFEEANKEMETYLIGGGTMHISAYSNNVA